MKTKIKIKTITDPETDVVINSPEHEIEEIKEEIHSLSSGQAENKIQIMEMFDK